jgi:hypothetical protein
MEKKLLKTAICLTFTAFEVGRSGAKSLEEAKDSLNEALRTLEGM